MSEPRDVWLAKAYEEVKQTDDAATAEAYLLELVELHPETIWIWFDLGLFAKRRRDWRECARLNAKSLELEVEQQDPAAWNLGIAATAMGNWKMARYAWSLYGVDLPEGDDEPRMSLGLTPIRLNPEPRHIGETKLRLDGHEYATEVVWGQRIDPARAIIRSMPTPESGHRFSDLVLHDGEPVGTRFIGDSERPVFAELALLERSGTPTLRLDVHCPTKDDANDLEGSFQQAGLGAEDWSTIRYLCTECSEGTPNPSHDHGVPDWEPQRDFAVGADPKDAKRLLREWARRGPDRSYGKPVRVV
jgi:hypothetical protein